MSKRIQYRNIGRKLQEQSTWEGLAILTTIGAGLLGLDPQIATAVVGAVATRAVLRSEQPKDGDHGA